MLYSGGGGQEKILGRYGGVGGCKKCKVSKNSMEKIAKIIVTEGNFCCFSPHFNNNFLLSENIAQELNVFHKGNDSKSCI